MSRAAHTAGLPLLMTNQNLEKMMKNIQ